MAWKPTPRPGVDLKALPLSPLQTYVVSRLDGQSDLEALAKATSLPPERLSHLLSELVVAGVVAPEPREPVDPGRSAADEEPVTDVDAASTPEFDDARDAPADPGEPTTDSHDAPLEEDPGADVPELSEAVTATHRELFETRLHAMEVDERVLRARTAVDPALSAYCFDPVPRVIQAVLDNPQVGLVQARLIAKHHHNPVGLEAMAAHAAFAADAGVRRGLLHNSILPGGLYRRLWGMRRLLDQYNVTISREVPEQTRRIAREVMRQRFATGPAEERVELIIKTEGRCLQALTGLPLDSKTTALLCGRTFGSTLLVQNIARWSAAPPALIAHLMRQESVRRSPMLRTLLERHPNAPSGP